MLRASDVVSQIHISAPEPHCQTDIAQPWEGTWGQGTSSQSLKPQAEHTESFGSAHVKIV